MLAADLLGGNGPFQHRPESPPPRRQAAEQARIEYRDAAERQPAPAA